MRHPTKAARQKLTYRHKPSRLIHCSPASVKPPYSLLFLGIEDIVHLIVECRIMGNILRCLQAAMELLELLEHNTVGLRS